MSKVSMDLFLFEVFPSPAADVSLFASLDDFCFLSMVCFVFIFPLSFEVLMLTEDTTPLAVFLLIAVVNGGKNP